MEFGWRIYGFGIIALSLVGFVWARISGQPVPKWFPERAALAYAAAASGARRVALPNGARRQAWAAAALLVYYGLVVLLLENGNGSSRTSPCSAPIAVRRSCLRSRQAQ